MATCSNGTLYLKSAAQRFPDRPNSSHDHETGVPCFDTGRALAHASPAKVCRTGRLRTSPPPRRRGTPIAPSPGFDAVPRRRTDMAVKKPLRRKRTRGRSRVAGFVKTFRSNRWTGTSGISVAVAFAALDGGVGVRLQRVAACGADRRTAGRTGRRAAARGAARKRGSARAGAQAAAARTQRASGRKRARGRRSRRGRCRRS